MNWKPAFRLSPKSSRKLRWAFGLSLGFLQIKAWADEYYTIQKGDTLSEIAQSKVGSPVYPRKTGSLQKILKKNQGIKNPNLIYPGQRVRLSDEGEVIFQDDPRFNEPLNPPPAPPPAAEAPPPVEVTDPRPKYERDWDYTRLHGRIVFLWEPNYLSLSQTLQANNTHFLAKGSLVRAFSLYGAHNLGPRLAMDGKVNYEDSHNIQTGTGSFLITHHSSGKVGINAGLSYKFFPISFVSVAPRLGIALTPTELFHFVSNTDLEVDQLGVMMATVGMNIAVPAPAYLSFANERDTSYLQLEYRRHQPSKSNYDFSQAPIQVIETRLIYEQPLRKSPSSVFYGVFYRQSWAHFTNSADDWKLRESIYGIVLGLGMNVFKNP